MADLEGLSHAAPFPMQTSRPGATGPDADLEAGRPTHLLACRTHGTKKRWSASEGWRHSHQACVLLLPRHRERGWLQAAEERGRATCAYDCSRRPARGPACDAPSVDRHASRIGSIDSAARRTSCSRIASLAQKRPASRSISDVPPAAPIKFNDLATCMRPVPVTREWTSIEPGHLLNRLGGSSKRPLPG